MSVKKIIGNVLGVDESVVTEDLSFQSISEWDSLRHIELIIALEKEWGITISNDLLLTLTSVSAINKFYLDSIVNKKATLENKEKTPNFATTVCDNSGVNKDMVYRGLNNVVFDTTAITNIDGKNGLLEYRGYSINDLVTFSNFEETAYLLLYGKLPTKEELELLDSQLKVSRKIPEEVISCLCIMKNASTTLALRTAISMLEYDNLDFDSTIEKTRDRGIKLIAQIPTIIAMHYRYKNNLTIVHPNPSLGHAANLLYMISGVLPSEKDVRIVEKILILHAEHSSNASTFTARVVIGTQSNIYAAITSAIAAFSGPLHGGAIEYTMKMLREIGKPEYAKAYVLEKRKKNESIMGFGHRVYRTEDPRAKHLRESLINLSQEKSDTKWIEILDAVIEEMKAFREHGVDVNVDYYACVIYHLLGLSDDLFIPMFIAGRISGWVAHVLEQLSNNILIRPIMKYEGEKSLVYEPIENRDQL